MRRSDASKPLHLAGVIRYLVCDDICIPYDADVALTLDPGDGKPSPFAHLINRYDATVPGDGKRHGVSIDAAETWNQGETTWLRVKASAQPPFQARNRLQRWQEGKAGRLARLLAQDEGKAGDDERRAGISQL